MMNFELTDEQQSVKEMVRKFVDKEIIPNIQERDRQGHFEPAILKKLADL
jgi:glutaryl-CoA dehydrogenase (non-decarboxylating)